MADSTPPGLPCRVSRPQQGAVQALVERTGPQSLSRGQFGGMAVPDAEVVLGQPDRQLDDGTSTAVTTPSNTVQS